MMTGKEDERYKAKDEGKKENVLYNKDVDNHRFLNKEIDQDLRIDWEKQKL